MNTPLAWLLALISLLSGVSAESFARAYKPVRNGPSFGSIQECIPVGDYRPNTCAYCQDDTWCEIRKNGKPQCRACQIERFYERVLYAPFPNFRLQGWGRKILRDLYGHLDPETGLRIYRRGYISTGKQNGKSFILGGLPIYHLTVEYESGNIFDPEAYGIASAKDQAAIVFKAAATLVEANPLLKAQLQVYVTGRRIVRRDRRGVYCVLSADGDVQDGKRPSLLLFDELHRFTRKKAETVRTVLLKGMISRAPVADGVQTGEPLMLQTTTSGDEFECPLWFSEYQHAQQVRIGAIEDPSYYAAIYQADPRRIDRESDCYDPEYWKSREARVAANPSHEDNGGFLADAELEKETKEAIARPEKYGDYVRLNLNVPVVATGTPVVEMSTWAEGAGGVDLRTWPEYDVELLISQWNLMNRACVIGIDFAWTTDFASVSVLFPPSEEDDFWRVLVFNWLPKDAIKALERRTRAPLSDWVRRKFLETCDGAEISMPALFAKVEWASRMFSVREVTFDRYGSVDAAASILLVPQGYLCVKVAQTIAGLTAGTKAFLGAYKNKRLIHGNNPVLNWNVSCLALLTDGGDQVKPIKPSKSTAAKRIDGVAATITAWSRAMFLAPAEKATVEIW